MSKSFKNKENKIYLNATINEVFATTELIQYFKNTLDNPIELQIQFPIKEDINLSKFEVIMNNKKVVSKILGKEKAKEKYSDAIAEGNTAIISKYSKNFKSYNINLGNINPKESLCLKTIYNQSISSYDMSYQYIIMKDFPSFTSDKEGENKKDSQEIIINANINTFSKITRLITNLEEKDNLTISYNKNYTHAKLVDKILENNKKKYSIDLHILFRTKDINKPNLFYQFNPILKKHSYCLHYLYSSDDIEKLIKVPKNPDEDDTLSYFTKYQSDLLNEQPSLFIFLVDQSGSMSGEPIDLVIKSLLIFIQSLPKDSYFQIIGFGSDFKKYNESPVKYNNKNINKIKEIIKNLKGDMGGTNIVKPLEDIFNNKKEYEKINLSKNILLLTDGEVDDKNECFNLIKENSHIFRIHSIGIGDSFDKELIELSGKYGKGSSNFVENLKNINNVIIKVLNKCLKPYLYDINFNFLNIKKEEKESIFVKMDNYIYQDEIINYSFILDDKKKVSYIDSQNNIFKFKTEFFKNQKKFENNFEFKVIMNLPEGDNLTKIIIDKYLKNNPNLDEKTEIKLAKEYEVLSKNTSLFAEISNEKVQKKQLITVNLLSKKSYFPTPNIHYRPSIGNKAARRSLPLMGRSFGAFRINRSRFSPENSQSDKSDDSENDNSKESESKKESEDNEEDENKNDIDLTEIIISQDAIDGFWYKNDETIKIEKLLSKKILNNINKICSKVIKKEKEKIYYTILIIYFISTKFINKLEEYKLILNKAKKYLKSFNIIYDDIISKIDK